MTSVAAMMTAPPASGTWRDSPRSPHAALPLRVATLLLGLVLLAVAGRARADCDYTNQPGTVTFTPPPTITLPDNPAVGTILWTSAPIVPANYPTLTCIGSTNSGIVNQAGAPVGGDNTLFPTNVPGLSYKFLHPDTSRLLHAYPDESISAGNIQFSVATALQLIVTGPIAPGSVFTGGQFAKWNADMCDVVWIFCARSRGTNPVEVFNSTSIRFVAPACSVVVDPTVVTLPTVFASAFTGVGSVTGQTPFNVQLNCPSAAAGASVAITLATSNPVAGATGVIAPTSGSGYAKRIGVQVLDGGGNPVPFNTAIAAGTVTAGAFNIPLAARYYQTDANPTAGQVKATATYTITYP